MMKRIINSALLSFIVIAAVTLVGCEHKNTEVAEPVEQTNVDCVSPVLECRGGVFLRDEELTPGMLVTRLEDDSPIQLQLSPEPDITSSDPQSIAVTATDIYGNSTEQTVEVTFTDYRVTFEATAEPITSNMVREQAGLPLLESDRDMIAGGYTGERIVKLYVDGTMYSVYVTVQDTTPPTAVAVDHSGFCGYPVEASALVTDIEDATDVCAAYLFEPDWDCTGETQAVITLTDAAGNQTHVIADLELQKDTEAPTIYMAYDYCCYVESITYFSQVYAEDNADPDVELTVDSQVNPRVPGTYSVTYTATDHAGNSSTASLNITVIEESVTEEQLDEVVNGILDTIITDDMTTPEKLKTIYWYFRSRIHYSCTSNHEDYRLAAYTALTRWSGDCYVSYAGLRALLEKIDGIELLEIRRSPDSPRHGNHYWLLCNVEGTGWYHLDAYNGGAGADRAIFMFTTDEVNRHNTDVWYFDPWLYPEVATDPYPYR